MDIFEGITENKLTLVLLAEKQYQKKLAEIVKDVEKSHTRICYVCLSKPYTDIVDYLKNVGINVNKFFFIDTLSSHYKKSVQAENCIVIEDTNKLSAIQSAINTATTEKKCSVVIFDTISALLMYEQMHDIVKFTSDLTTTEKHQDVHKIFLILKKSDSLVHYHEDLINDISMFADKIIDLEGKPQKLKQELEALEQAYKSGYISEESYQKNKKRIEDKLKG